MQACPAAVRKHLVLLQAAELMRRPDCTLGSPCSFGASELGCDAFVLKVDIKERMGPRHLPVCRMVLTLDGGNRQQGQVADKYSEESCEGCPLGRAH